MQLVFFTSIIFAIWYKFARYVLLTAIATAITLIFGKALVPDVPLSLYGSITQCIIWLPVFIGLIIMHREIIEHIKSVIWHSKVYGIWLAILLATMTASLSLNIKYLLS